MAAASALLWRMQVPGREAPVRKEWPDCSDAADASCCCNVFLQWGAPVAGASLGVGMSEVAMGAWVIFRVHQTSLQGKKSTVEEGRESSQNICNAT